MVNTVARAAVGVHRYVECDQMSRMADRLRALLDLVTGSEPGIDGAELARRAHFSRDHLDRMLAGATGESPVALRRRLLLERAAWQLRNGASAADAASAAGYGSQAAFSRAFARAYGAPPSRYSGPTELSAPNGVHFHPPAGLLVPGTRPSGSRRDPAHRLLQHHVDRTRELLSIAAGLPLAALERPLRPGLVVVWFEGEEASAAVMAERLVATLEIWTSAIAGEVAPERNGDLRERFERAALAFNRLIRDIRARGAWDDAFIDALCEPPQSFTYGGVLAHVLTYGAIRREHLAGVLAELGAAPGPADPILWEQARLR